MSYVNKSEYLLFDGINLEIELPDDDNIKNKVDRFINEVETTMIIQLKMYGFKESNINDSNRNAFKQAIMYQIREVLKNGRESTISPISMQILRQNRLISIGRW